MNEIAIDKPQNWFGNLMRRVRAKGFMNIGFMAFVLLLVIFLACIFAPLITSYDPIKVDISSKLLSPSEKHLMGTDDLGRDIFARILYGGRTAFTISFLGSIFSLVMALILGVTAGYYKGWVDDIIGRVFDIKLAFPAILLAIVVVAALGNSLINVTIAIAIVYLPRFGRICRAATIEVTQRDYIRAAKALGYSDLRIILNHVLINIVGSILIVVTVNMGRMILAESSLSFLGAGIQPPTPSWGLMVKDGRQFLQFSPHVIVFPGGILTVVCLLFNYIGDWVRDLVDIKSYD